jgi:cytochrome b561
MAGYYNTARAYGSIQKILHWLMAVLILGQFILAWIFTNLPKDNRLHNKLFQTHALIGMSILILVIARILWRSNNPQVLFLNILRPIERTIAGSVHLFLYVAMLFMPISGYLMVTGKGHDLNIWGLVIPSLIHSIKAAAAGHVAHFYLGYCLLAAIVLHVIGAFFHKNRVLLKRML